MRRLWDKVKKEWVINTEALPPPRFRIHKINGIDDMVMGLILRAKRLLPREREILTLRLPVDSVKPVTLPELAKKYNLSRIRIGQIEKAGLKKLGIYLHRPPSQSNVTRVVISREGTFTNAFDVETAFGLRCILVAIHGDITIDNGAYI